MIMYLYSHAVRGSSYHPSMDVESRPSLSRSSTQAPPEQSQLLSGKCFKMKYKPNLRIIMIVLQILVAVSEVTASEAIVM